MRFMAQQFSGLWAAIVCLLSMQYGLFCVFLSFILGAAEAQSFVFISLKMECVLVFLTSTIFCHTCKAIYMEA